MAGQKKDYNDLNRLRSLLSKSSRTISENNVEALNEYCFIGIPLLTMKIMKLVNTTNFYFYHKLCFGFFFSWLIFLSSSFCLCSRTKADLPDQIYLQLDTFSSHLLINQDLLLLVSLLANYYQPSLVRNSSIPL
jgi:hypothetical protein